MRKRKGRQVALPPFPSSDQRLVGRNCSCQNNQQQQRHNNAACRRGGCLCNNFWFHSRFNHAASESGGSSNRQSGSKSDLFHLCSPVLANRRIRRGDGLHPRIFLVTHIYLVILGKSNSDKIERATGRRDFVNLATLFRHLPLGCEKVLAYPCEEQGTLQKNRASFAQLIRLYRCFSEQPNLGANFGQPKKFDDMFII